MIFDDTFNHEVWNDTDETRVVLFVDVLRPLPSPGSRSTGRSSRRSATRPSCWTPSAIRKPGKSATGSASPSASVSPQRQPGSGRSAGAQMFETSRPVP